MLLHSEYYAIIMLMSNYRRKLEMNGTEVDHITRPMGYENSFWESSVGKLQTIGLKLRTYVL